MKNSPDRKPPAEIPAGSIDVFAQQKSLPEDPCPTYIAPEQAAILIGVDVEQIEAWMHTNKIDHDGSVPDQPLIDLHKFQSALPNLFDLSDDLTGLQIYGENEQ